MFSEKKREGRAKVDREADDQQVLQLEEKDVVSSVATVLSDLCGPGEWMPMEKLHSMVSSSLILTLPSFVTARRTIKKAISLFTRLHINRSINNQ